MPHLRRCSEKDTVAVSPTLPGLREILAGRGTSCAPTPLHPAWPSGDTGGAGVAIELRPILQPTSLRARWTPRRDEFRVVRDDRRLVIMGAG